MSVTVTLPTLRVLRLFLDAPERELYLTQISKATGIAFGTLSPMFHRLSKNGWLTSRMEEEFGNHQGPPHRYWKLTELGIKQSQLAIETAIKQLSPDGNHNARNHNSPDS